MAMLLTLKITMLSAQNKTDTKTPIPLSLTDVWAKAATFSKAIQIKKLNVAGSKEEIKDARAERLPEISVGGNFEQASNIPMYENGIFHAPAQHEVIHTLYKFGADAYLNIYNGNKTNLNIEEKLITGELATVQEAQTTSTIRLRAVACYLNLQKSLIFKKLMLKDIADQEKQLELIKQFHKNGVVLKSDVLRTELKLSNQKMSLVRIENDIEIANQQLNIIIGEPDDQPNNPVDELNIDSLLLKPYEVYLEEAMEKAYAWKISAQETALRKVALKDVKANVSPKIGMYAEYNYAYPQIFLYPYSPSLYGLGIVGVRASFPVSGFYLNKHKVKVAALEYEKQEMEHGDTEDNIRQQVKAAYLRYQESVIRIGVAVVNVNQATENLRIINNTYFNQTSLITDLLDADVQLLQTNFELAAAKIAARLQYYQLQDIIGNL